MICRRFDFPFSAVYFPATSGLVSDFRRWRHAYIYGDQPLERIENKMVDNGKHVLIIHDSFGNCVVPFLAMGIQYVDSLDLRHFNGSLHNYIEKEKPDMVIVLYNADMLQGPTVKRDGVFDFR